MPVGSKFQKERMQAMNSRYEDRLFVRVCCYCKSKNHKASACDKVKDVGERRILAAKSAQVPDTGHQNVRATFNQRRALHLVNLV